MRRPAAAFALWLLCLTACAYAQDDESTEPIPKSATAQSSPLLHRNALVSIGVVKQFFPALTQQTGTGPDTSAVDNPAATRTAVYGSRDGAKQITLTVDQYEYGSQAMTAYQQAARKTEAPEFGPIAISNVGEQVFAGTMGRDAEMRVIITAVDDALLVGGEMKGYEETTDNIARLVELLRAEISQAHAHVSARRKRQPSE